MKFYKTLLGMTVATGFAALSAIGAGTTATFDWEEFDGNWWDDASFAYSETNNGVIMNASGRASGAHGGDGPGGENGNAFKADYSNDSAPGYFNMSEGGAAAYFVVNSIDINASGGGEYTPTVQGTLAGLVVWTITPTENVGLTTYTAATSGDMSDTIDRIVWNTGVSATPGLNYNNQIDNLNVITADAPVSGEDTASFDWEEHAGVNWWENYNLSETNNGFVLQASGRATVNSGGDGAGGNNGFGFKASYSQDSADGAYIVQQAGTNIFFVANSLEIKGDVNNTNAALSGELVIRGTLGGVEQWAIEPVEDGAFHTYTTATSGDMSKTIDKILWSAPYDPTDTLAHWNNAIDNLNITKAAMPDVEYNALFDWAEFVGFPWDGYDYSETENGFTMQASFRASGSENNGGYAVKTTYAEDSANGIFTISEGGPIIEFRVVSMDIAGDVGNSGLLGDLEVKGMLGGEGGIEVWSIDPVEDNEFHTYLSATTGDITAKIDTIVWSGPYDPSGVALLWNNKIDNLAITTNEVVVLTGYEAYVDSYGLVYGDPNTLEYDDYDLDGAQNIYEYGWNGDMTNSLDVGVLPVLEVVGGVATYTMLEVKDPLSGISYTVETTEDLVSMPFAEPTWDSVSTNAYDENYDSVVRGLNTVDAEFFQSEITSDAP